MEESIKYEVLHKSLKDEVKIEHESRNKDVSQNEWMKDETISRQ